MTSQVGFAALDLGTSRLRAGVLEPASDEAAPCLRVLDDRQNEVRVAAGGVARCSFAAQWNSVRELLRSLATWCQSRGVQRLHLGLCGQVSSLLRWDESRDAPAEDEYPIWMDSTCRPALEPMREFFGNGGAERMLGTCLPVVTTWLAVKARGQAQHRPDDRASILQIQDAVFRRLTGKCLSHPSSQISLVHQDSWSYAPEVLKFVGLTPERLPTLDPQGSAEMRDSIRIEAGLPPVTVHVGMMDTHAALFGMFPGDGDGLLLTGTSEVLGVFERQRRTAPPRRMVRARLGDGWIVYGSTASGGNSVRWLMDLVLRKNMDADLARLSDEAETLAPGCDGLFCLPYFNGERAPLWNSELTGSFVGLRTHHRDTHLLRALMEGIALTRRQAAEALERPMPARFLVAGGGAANALWNRIRASALNRPLEIMTAGDLALIGAIRHAMVTAGEDEAPLRALLATSRVEPEPDWVPSYEKQYPEFLRTQKMMGIHISEDVNRA